MKRIVATLLVLGAVSFVGPAVVPAEEAAIAWNQVLGAAPNALSAAQRGRVAALLRTEFCYFGCSKTIARCLSAPDPNRTARRLAGYVVRQVQANQTDADIRDGIRKRGLSAHPVETVRPDLSNAQCHGPADAPVTIVEYADFECPFCRIVSPALGRISRSMESQVRVCFKHFPVRGHERAVPASIAAQAAAAQGRFWPMHDALYASSPRLGEEDLVAAARRAGLADLGRWQQDRTSQATRQQVEADKLEGIRNGVRGTPTIFVNGKEYLGQKDEAELRDRIEEELDIVRHQA